MVQLETTRAEPGGIAIRTLDVKKSSRSLPSHVDVDETATEVYRFECGHEECGSQFTAPTRDKLMLLIEQHLKEAHSVEKLTGTLRSYLEATCVTVWRT
jgi:hypothetical protein